MPDPSAPHLGRADKLRRLLAEPKAFERPDAAGAVDSLIEEMARNQERFQTKNQVLDRFRQTLKPLRGAGFEDKQRICDWLEKILEIQGMESSDGLLDAWLHGISL